MKRAILFALDHFETAKEQRRPTCLLPLGDRPIIHHIIEELIHLGIQKVEILLHDNSQEISQTVGDSNRWGITIQTHLVKDPKQPLTTLLSSIKSWPESSILLGDASEWVNLLPLEEKLREPCHIVDQEQRPTNWALLKKEEIAKEALIPEALPTIAAETIRFHSLSALFDTTISLLNGTLPKERNPHIREAEPGVWIGRAVVIHPEAEITAPVFIGPNTRIHSKARVGPHAFIEGDAIIDHDSIIENSVILEHSFVGEGLELDGCVVDRNWLFKREFENLVTIPDHRILSDLSSSDFLNAARKIFDRTFSIAILFFTWPLITYLICRYGLKWSRVVTLPAIDEPALWRSCNWLELNGSPSPVLRWLPRLLNVAAGNAQIVGIRPRNSDELRELAEDWRSRVLPTTLGSLSPQEALAMHDTDPMQQLITECYYAAHKGVRHDLKLLWRFLFGRR